jgi:hypothetical protein
MREELNLHVSGYQTVVLLGLYTWVDPKLCVLIPLCMQQLWEREAPVDG